MGVTIPSTYKFLGGFGERDFGAGLDVLATSVEYCLDNTHWAFSELARRKPGAVFWGSDSTPTRAPLTWTATSLSQHFQLSLSLPTGRKRIGYYADFEGGQVELGRRGLGGGGYTVTTSALSSPRTTLSGTWVLTAGTRYDLRVRLRAYDGVTPIKLYGVWFFEPDAAISDMP